jgi:hypothetical protein
MASTYGNLVLPPSRPVAGGGIEDHRSRRAIAPPIATPIYGLSPAVLPRRCLRVANRMLTPLRQPAALFQSALPNLIPLMAQFASKVDFGFVRCTIIPTQGSQPGSVFLTPSVIAACIAFGMCPASLPRRTGNRFIHDATAIDGGLNVRI